MDFSQFIKHACMEKKQYQQDGVDWIVKNETNVTPVYGVRGGFIADEMGLGKTLMMIGVCLSHFRKRTLIVLPPILIDQWVQAIFKTTGHQALVFHGHVKKGVTKVMMESVPLVIASYAEISLSKKKKSLLHEIHWSRVIFDEAHHLRNANTSRFRGAKCIRADIRWLVSGTPIQNRKQDFYALCNVLGLPTSYYTDSVNLRELTKHFLLKRSKKSVGLEISEICVENVIVPWKNEKEKNLSRDIHCMSYSKNVISMLLKARQSCTLPRLLSNHLSGLMKSGILTQSYKEGLLSTSKLDAVIQNIVERKGNGNGKIVFCHFKEEIQEVAKRLKEKEMNVGIIDGRVTVVSRNALLKERKDVLILQIQTCCEGLNLQENYSEVFFVSPHWNPFIEDQAVARCHRMGQKKVVFVKRYEMDEFDAESDKNVERYVNEVQESKRLIVKSVMS